MVTGKKLKWLIILSFSLMLFGLLNSGCSDKESKEIKIGSILGLTGNYAEYGVKMNRGFDLALEQIKSDGGINGKEIRLIIEDSQFDPTKSVSAYKKLHDIDGVKIFVGITGSRNAIPVCEASKNDNIIIIDALGSAPKLTTAGGPNYFRIMASDALAGKFNVSWAVENGMKRPAIIYMEDDWGASYRDAVINYLSEAGFDNYFKMGVTAGMRDFRTQIEKLKDYSPDAIFLLVYAREGASFMQQLRQADIKAAIYGSDNISSDEFLSVGNDVAEGVFVAMPAPVEGKLYDKFAQQYRNKFNEEPDANVIKSYDALMLTAYAIGKVGTEPEKLREFLKSDEFSYTGVSGEIKFDKNGDLLSQKYTKMIYKNGKLETLE